MRPPIGAGCGCSIRGMPLAQQWEAWRQANRYSFAEMAALADQEAFHGRRMRLHVEAMQRSLCRWFRHDSGFSAADLAHVLDNSPAPETWLAAVLREARRREESQSAEPVSEAFSFARTIHTLGSALQQTAKQATSPGCGLSRPGSPLTRRCTTGSIVTGWGWPKNWTSGAWTCRAQSLAFDYLRRKIVTGGGGDEPVLRQRLAKRRDRLGAGPGPTGPGRRLERHPAVHPGERRDGSATPRCC